MLIFYVLTEKEYDCPSVKVEKFTNILILPYVFVYS